MLTERQASYEPDMAAAIDRPEEILADDLGITLDQAKAVMAMIERVRMEQTALALGRVVGWLLAGKHMQVRIYALAFAAGLDQLNGLHSQSEAARQLGVTRALISHYVTSARDAIGINVQKFRKSDRTRETFRQAQLNRHHH
jgi:hypothetical protein